MLEEIQNEICIMQYVDHPNIVKYYETYDDENFLYLCLELLAGGQLKQKIEEKKQPYKEKNAAIIMEKLLMAVNHCHTLGVIHKDIKPENIMFDIYGNVKLIDFGLSCFHKDGENHK